MRNRLRSMVDSNWFSLADLGITLGSGAVWYLHPQWGWKVLLAALLPKGVRLLAGKAPVKWNIFDLSMAVFLITALVGAGISYDNQGSWAKFWLLVTGVLLFYSLASQRAEHTWLLVYLLAGLAALVAFFFLLIYDWQAQPVRFGFINHLGNALMHVRPIVQFRLADSDSISNALMVLSPFSLSAFVHAFQIKRSRPGLFLFASVALLLLLLGFVMAALQEFLLVIVLGVFIFAWYYVGRVLEMKSSASLRQVFLFGTMILGIVILFLFSSFPGAIHQEIQGFSTLSRFDERLTISKNAIHLIEDFPFTGGGLGAFPGLYSQYILGISYLFISASYNLFLEMAVEQGLIGCLAYASILVGGLFTLVFAFSKKQITEERKLFMLMLLAGYWTVIIAGTVDSTLYDGLGILTLFVIPGLGALEYHPPRKIREGGGYPDLILGLGLILFVLILGKNFFSAYYANLGAVSMEQLDLEGWTWAGDRVEQPLDAYQGVSQILQMTLHMDGENSAANYRMGMLAMSQRDFPAGCQYLQTALNSRPTHRGILKQLGYCSVWLGQIDQAYLYLQEIPEASDELSTYTWWWETQDRNDLSDFANRMVKRLNP